MIDLCEIPVGDPGKAFIQSVFELYLGLSAQLADLVGQHGSCYGILPQGTPISRAQDFNSGYAITEQSRSKWLQNRLTNYATAGRRGVILVQDLFCGPNDHTKHPPQTNYFVSGGQIYFWEEFGPDHIPDVRLLLDQPKIPDGLAAFLVEDPDLSSSFRAGRANLTHVVDTISEFYVPAYDDESFVMWVR